MSETVPIALITACAGVAGALLGAVGATVGPWWLSRSERRSRLEEERLELRRAAIVEFIDAQVSLANHLDPGSEETKRRSIRANQALIELGSRLKADELDVDTFVHELARHAGTLKADRVNERFLIVGVGGRLLLGWHRGNLASKAFRPLGVSSKGDVEYVTAWGLSPDSTSN